MARKRILIVDDETGMLEVCAAILKKLPDAEVCTEQDSQKAAERFKQESFDLLIVDNRMPGLSGIDLLRLAREQDPNLAMLMMTAFPSVETAVQSMKLGAADYITKPFLPEDLLATARRLLETSQLREENRLLQRQVTRVSRFGEIIGQSSVMHALFDTIRRIAESDVDALIIGETGTGKELVARSIHEQSSRRKHRFVPVDCGAIPEDLLESELFGHERGAFTGAHARSLGLLEFANKGTFFLDEIGELPIRLQAKLLRALQERRIRRVGGKEEIDLDVRIVSATARNLDEEVEMNRFRSDLYYRINVARIEVPPLRERIEDLPLLIEHFIDQYATQAGKADVRMEADVLEVLSSYAWPGNIRELQNVIRRTLVMAKDRILKIDDLPGELVDRAGTTGLGTDRGFFYLRDQHAANFEREYLANLLERCQGDVSRAARESKLPRGTFYRILKKYQIEPEQFRK